MFMKKIVFAVVIFVGCMCVGDELIDLIDAKMKECKGVLVENATFSGVDADALLSGMLADDDVAKLPVQAGRYYLMYQSLHAYNAGCEKLSTNKKFIALTKDLKKHLVNDKAEASKLMTEKAKAEKAISDSKRGRLSKVKATAIYEAYAKRRDKNQTAEFNAFKKLNLMARLVEIAEEYRATNPVLETKVKTLHGALMPSEHPEPGEMYSHDGKGVKVVIVSPGNDVDGRTVYMVGVKIVNAEESLPALIVTPNHYVDGELLKSGIYAAVDPQNLPTKEGAQVAVRTFMDKSLIPR